MKGLNINRDETVGVGGELVAPADISHDEEERIRKRISAAVGRKAHRRARGVLRIAAAMLAVFVLAACTAEVLDWDISLSNLLKASQEDKLYAEKSGLFSEYSGLVAAADGVEIELKQATADKRICFLVFEARLAEKPADALYFPCYGINADISSDCGIYSNITMPDRTGDPDEPRFSFAVCVIFHEEYEEGESINMRVNSVSYNSERGRKELVGPWELSFKPRLSSKVKSGTLDKACVIPGAREYSTVNESYQESVDVAGRLTGYELTPLSLTLTFESDEYEAKEAERLCDASRSLMWDSVILINYADGTQEEISCINYDNQLSSVYESGTRSFTGEYVFSLKRIIDIDKVTSIEFAGAAFEVS